mmetsp:Transcript_133369/g.345162  ORF Transcript_133369/g.345162 Transcript_133369/m.345162 type:complete len:213 (+) Transcript_133369:224-862(+)
MALLQHPSSRPRPRRCCFEVRRSVLQQHRDRVPARPPRQLGMVLCQLHGLCWQALLAAPLRLHSRPTVVATAVAAVAMAVAAMVAAMAALPSRICERRSVKGRPTSTSITSGGWSDPVCLHVMTTIGTARSASSSRRRMSVKGSILQGMMISPWRRRGAAVGRRQSTTSRRLARSSTCRTRLWPILSVVDTAAPRPCRNTASLRHSLARMLW